MSEFKRKQGEMGYSEKQNTELDQVIAFNGENSWYSMEFLFWSLGTWSQRKNYAIETLILARNEIDKESEPASWEPFFFFLPFLQRLDLAGNKGLQGMKLHYRRVQVNLKQ